MYNVQCTSLTNQHHHRYYPAYKDFVPKCIRPTTYGVSGEYEGYSSMVDKVNEWLAESMSGVELINMQCMEFPVLFGQGYYGHTIHNGSFINTHTHTKTHIHIVVNSLFRKSNNDINYIL